jgi:hypothetical protein
MIEMQYTSERRINSYKIIQTLRSKGSLSKRELGYYCGLSRPTIDNIMEEFLEKKLIYRDGYRSSSCKGRNPVLYAFNEKIKYAIGVDFEVPALNIVLADLSGVPVAKKSMNISPEMKDPHLVLDYVGKEIISFIKQRSLDIRDIVGLGFGTPGIFTGDLVTIPTRHFSNWKKIPMKNILEGTLEAEVFLDNDVNFMMFSEKFCMDYKDENLIYVALRKDIRGKIKIGAGILINNEIFRGHHGNAGLIAHLCARPSTEKCSCGNTGCLEKVIEEKMKDDISETEDCLALSIFNMFLLFDPARIIINAEIFGDQEDCFIEGVQKKLQDRLMRLNVEPKIEKAQDRELTCAKGAVLYALQNLFSNPLNLIEKLEN